MPAPLTIATGRSLLSAPAGGVDWLALLQARAYESWDGSFGLSADRLTWTGCVLGRVVTSTNAPGAATLNGHAAVNITASNQGYRRSAGDVEITNPFTILAVFDSTDIATTTQYAFDAQTGRYIAMHTGTASVHKWFDGAFRGDASPTLGAQVMRWTHNGANTSVYRNGALITSGAGTARNISGVIGVWGRQDLPSLSALLGVAAHLSLYSSEANAVEVEAAAIARFGIV